MNKQSLKVMQSQSGFYQNNYGGVEMNKEILTQNLLKEILCYDEKSGIFTWKEIKVKNQVKKGSVAGWKDKGYLRIEINGSSYRLHRLAWLYVYGYMPIFMIDHINGIRDDNRIVNLREATDSQNKQNIKKANKNNKTGYLGVSPQSGGKTFRAEIAKDKVRIMLGTFKTAIEAHHAYIEAKQKMHEFSTI